MKETSTNTERSTYGPPAQPNWITNATLLWQHRRLLARGVGLALLLSVAIALLIPKRYESVARLMPPEQPGSGFDMLNAIAGHSAEGLGSLGSLAGSLLGGRTSSSLFIDILRSNTIADRLIDRFNLQTVYRKRYRIDAAKYLARRTKIVDDNKSGVITLTVTDADPRRAQAIAQAYLDELNGILTTSNISSARRERQFIETRLVSVQAELQSAEKALGGFSSTHTMLDIKEQTHAMVDAAAKLQAEIIVGQSELNSLKQIYGPENVRVRAAQARVATLQGELTRLGGNSAATSDELDDGSSQDHEALYPSLRQLPRLAVPYTDLYRRVRIEETVFELLSRQYEMARIQEAKDTPVVSILDLPRAPEKKSFPPRLLVVAILTTLAGIALSTFILFRHLWRQVDANDPRRLLTKQMHLTFSTRIKRLRSHNGEAL